MPGLSPENCAPEGKEEPFGTLNHLPRRCGVDYSIQQEGGRVNQLAIMVMVALATAISVCAMNGTAVYTHWWWPTVVEDVWNPAEFERGTLVVAKIQNNTVISRDTIYKSLAQYPALDCTGTRVAFFRWGLQVQMDAQGRYHPVAGTQNAQSYISVINIDGSGLRNLVAVSAPCVTSNSAQTSDNNEGNCLLDWTCGQWIYYEKPTKTSEIWRINVVDPSRNERVCSYGTNLRRWDLSWNAQYSGWQSRGSTVFNGGSSFPGLSSRQFCTACNAAVSCGGNFLAHYYGGQHSDMFCSKWHPGFVEGYDINWIPDVEGWLGEKITLPNNGGADLIRWSVNSEKWVLRQIGWCGQATPLTYGSNQIAVNWKDNQAINVSHTPPPPNCDPPYLWWEATNPPIAQVHSDCADAGDLWVDLGANNLFKWEDESGQLHSISPIDPVGVNGDASPAELQRRGGRPFMAATSDGLRIESPEGRNLVLTVTDMQGRTVLRRDMHGVKTLDNNVLPKGVYLAGIQGSQGTQTAALVVQ